MIPFEIRQPRLLLVEGERDRRFLTEMLGYLGVRPDIQVAAYHGKNNLCNVLHALAKTEAFWRLEALGLTRDADTQGRHAALQSLHGALYRAGLSVCEKKLIPCYAHLRISLQVIADSNGRGRLEEMILEAVSHHPLMAYVDHKVYTRRRSLNLMDEGKTRVDLLLDCKAQFGLEARQPYFNFDHPVYDSLKVFLRGL